jgi:hypothetical protein
LKIKIETKDFEKISQEMLKDIEKSKEVLGSAVDKAGNYLKPVLENKMPMDSTPDGIHIKKSVELFTATKGKKKFNAAYVTVGDSGKYAKGKKDKKVKYAMALEFGFKTVRGKRKKGKEYVKSIVYSNQTGNNIGNIIIREIVNKLGL